MKLRNTVVGKQPTDFTVYMKSESTYFSFNWISWRL